MVANAKSLDRQNAYGIRDDRMADENVEGLDVLRHHHHALHQALAKLDAEDVTINKLVVLREMLQSNIVMLSDSQFLSLLVESNTCEVRCAEFAAWLCGLQDQCGNAKKEYAEAEVQTEPVQLGPELPETAPQEPVQIVEETRNDSHDSHVGDTYIKLGHLRKVLESGDVALLRGSWLSKHASELKKLPRRQELPSEAFWGTSDVAGLFELCENALAETKKTESAPWLPFLSIIWNWQTPGHPDPEGNQFNEISSVVSLFVSRIRREMGHIRLLDCAVFLDWTCLFQEPRSRVEEASYQRGVKEMNCWYCHQLIHKLQLTGVSDDRGWPTVERAMSLMAGHEKVFDLGAMGTRRAGDWTGFQHKCSLDGKPPQVPKLFNNIIDEKTFTNESDRAVAKQRYREAFFALVGSRQVLSYVGLKWGPKDAKGLVAVLNNCRWLKELDLADNRIGDKGVDHLAPSLASLDSLELLSLHNNDIGDEGAICLSTALLQMKNLTRLILFSNRIRQAGARSLAKSFPECPRLKILALGDNQIGDKGCEYLATQLPKVEALETISISGNDIGYVGMQSMVECLPKCRNLNEFAAHTNRIDDAGLELLAGVLPQCSHLTWLELGVNAFSDSGVSKLARVLPSCEELFRLDLQSNKISDQGATRLALALQSCKKLTKCVLSDCNIGDAGARSFAAAIPKAPKLDLLYLDGNQLARSSQMMIRNAWERANKAPTTILRGEEVDSLAI